MQCSSMYFKVYCHTYNEKQDHSGITHREDGDWNVSRNLNSFEQTEKSSALMQSVLSQMVEFFLCVILGDDLYIGTFLKQILWHVLYLNRQYGILSPECFSVLRVLIARVYKDGLVRIVFP